MSKTLYAGRRHSSALGFKFRVVNSAGKGQGVIALQDIPAEMPILEYTGIKEPIEKFPEMQKTKGRDYIVMLDRKTLLWAGEHGATHFSHVVNTADKPEDNNCILWYDDEDTHKQYILSTRPIKEGEELLVSYGEDYIVEMRKDTQQEALPASKRKRRSA